MIKKILGVIFVIVIIFTLFIWRTKSNTKQVQNEKVSILLDWFPNTNHTGLYAAKDKGYFKNQNLDVEILQSSGQDPIQIVAAGKADFAISSQEAVTLARTKDIPVVSIAAIIQHNTSAFASLAENNITSVRDFEGKRYGGWGSPIEEAVIQAVMQDAHADYAKVKNITIGETDFFKTIGKDSDFQWIFYGWDGIEAKRRGIVLSTIMLKDLNPILDYYTPVIITNENTVSRNKAFVRRFMKAVSQGYTYAISHPAEASELLLKNAPELNTDLVKQSQDYLSRQYQNDAPYWGVQKEEVWSRYANWLYEHKLLEKKDDPNKMFTNEFLNG